MLSIGFGELLLCLAITGGVALVIALVVKRPSGPR